MLNDKVKDFISSTYFIQYKAVILLHTVLYLHSHIVAHKTFLKLISMSVAYGYIPLYICL